jgi:hypothetical protein
MKNFIAALFFLPAIALAAGSDYPLDSAPIEPRDHVSLRGNASGGRVPLGPGWSRVMKYPTLRPYICKPASMAK